MCSGRVIEKESWRGWITKNWGWLVQGKDKEGVSRGIRPADLRDGAETESPLGILWWWTGG